MAKEKTIEEWLKELPSHCRDKAIFNTRQLPIGKLFQLESSKKDALLAAFVWAHTEEGHEYWQKIHDSL